MSKIAWLNLFIVLTILISPVSAQGPTTWTEDWSDGWEGRWYYFGGLDENCVRTESGVLIQDCWATALVSEQSFPVSKTIEFSGTLFSRPGDDSYSKANLAHHVLFGVDDMPVSELGEYCGLFLQYDTDLRRDRFLIISYPDHYLLPQTYEHEIHEVSIKWVPSGDWTDAGERMGTCFYSIDGEQVHYTPYYSFAQTEVTLWQGATSVASGESNDGSSSFAEHGEITVTVGR